MRDPLDRWFTPPSLAAELVAELPRDDSTYIEPSAGEGAFFRALPEPRLAFDVSPQFSDCECADFLSLPPLPGPVTVVGNPPFGRCASTAVRFLRRAAEWPQLRRVSFILPRSFLKQSVQSRVRGLRLESSRDLGSVSFELHGGGTRRLGVVWQTWVPGEQPRLSPALSSAVEFVPRALATHAIIRAGGRAGRVVSVADAPFYSYFMRELRPGVLSLYEFRYPYGPPCAKLTSTQRSVGKRELCDLLESLI